MAKNAKQLAALIGLMFAVVLINLALDGSLNRWGIVPRSLSGLMGIPCAPFLHADLAHLLSNAIPLLVLGILASLGKTSLLTLTAEITLLAGLGVWLVGRNAVHIGASGLVFGYFGYVLARAWLTRSLLPALAGLLTMGLYSGLIWGVLPGAPDVSWEGHLCGLLAGVLLAYLEQRAPKSVAPPA